MSSLVVMLVRHAEKPDEAYPGPGLNPDGKFDDKSLVIRGWQRAGAWSALFGQGQLPDYPRPNVIYAAKPEPVEKGAKFSHRPWATAIPTADRLQLAPNLKWGVGQENELVEDIRQLTGVALIFWEHKTLVSGIIPALIGEQFIPGVPKKWDSDRFDVVLRFERSGLDALWSFRQLNPRLLSNDSDAPFSKVT